MYGNLINRFMEGPSASSPVVGMGATILMYSDRHAATVIAVEKNGREVVVQRDKATRTDSHGMSDSQSYTYERDPAGETARYSLRRNGRWVRVGDPAKNGQGLALGTRDEHYDYSF
jgi:hypothetical protein